MSQNEFWAQDMTQIHGRRNWFSRLSPQRKIIYSLLFIFVVAWCFFIGFNIANALEPDPDDWVIATKDDLGDALEDELLEIDGIRTILMVGCDAREGETTSRSDTMMLAFINGDTGTVSLLSIPRDCYVQIAGYSTKTKINHSFSYGGINLTMDTIEYFLGIKIDDYVLVDFQGFIDLVDALDGVEINVDQRMINYDEAINLNPGQQTLDGKQALGYCRFRLGQDGTDSISDVKRAEHQQNFILALKNKLISLSTVWKVPKLVGLANKYLDYSFSSTDGIKLANTLLNMNLENIKTYTVPTGGMYINGISYEIVNKAATLEILNEIIGNEYTYTPHIIDDGGAGRYTNDAPETTPDEEAPDLGEPTETPTDNGGTDNGGNAGAGGDTNDSSDSGNSGDSGEDGGADDIPEPQ